MSEYQDFSTSNHKLEKLWNKSEDNRILDEQLKKITISLNPVAYTKKIITIPILANFNLTPITTGGGGGGGGG